MADRFDELKTYDNYHKDIDGWEYVDIDDRRQLQKSPSGEVSLYISPSPELSIEFLNAFEHAVKKAYEESPVMGKQQPIPTL